MIGTRTYNVATSYVASTFSLARGLIVRELGPRPEQRLELYEYEACPYCRRVREALSELDLEAMIYPCPKGGQRFRPKAHKIGGQTQFPLLVDPNTDRVLYESLDIVEYLYQHYGTGQVPTTAKSPIPFASLGALASLSRMPNGYRATSSSAPAQPLELYSFEASPYCRLVREKLSSLELPYILHNVAKKSPSRPAFRAISGRIMVPYLIDPNSGVDLFESEDIVAYLEETYGRP